MKSCRDFLIIAVLVVIGLCVCAHAATKPLTKAECKQIQATPTMADNVIEELLRGVSGRIIEYYNWFFRPKSLSGGAGRTFGRPIRKLKNALIPIMFWMGIVFSMIKFIMFLSMKSVAIGLTILTINVAFIASKIALFFKGGHGAGAGLGGGFGKDVHVHVHPTTGTAFGKPLGGWNDRSSGTYKNSYFVTEDGTNVAYHAWPQESITKERPAAQEEPIKKRSTSEIVYEYELPHQMGVVPPTPNMGDVEKIKSRRSLKV